MRGENLKKEQYYTQMTEKKKSSSQHRAYE